MLIQQLLLLLFTFVHYSIGSESKEIEISEEKSVISEKAFTAECGDSSGPCTYSVVFLANSATLSYTAPAKITINGVGEEFKVTVDGANPPYVKNFEVYQGDQIAIHFDPAVSVTDVSNTITLFQAGQMVLEQ